MIATCEGEMVCAHRGYTDKSILPQGQRESQLREHSHKRCDRRMRLEVNWVLRLHEDSKSVRLPVEPGRAD